MPVKNHLFHLYAAMWYRSSSGLFIPAALEPRKPDFYAPMISIFLQERFYPGIQRLGSPYCFRQRWHAGSALSIRRIIRDTYPDRTAFFPNQSGDYYSKSTLDEWFHEFWDQLPEAAVTKGNPPRSMIFAILTVFTGWTNGLENMQIWMLYILIWVNLWDTQTLQTRIIILHWLNHSTLSLNLVCTP